MDVVSTTSLTVGINSPGNEVCTYHVRQSIDQCALGLESRKIYSRGRALRLGDPGLQFPVADHIGVLGIVRVHEQGHERGNGVVDDGRVFVKGEVLEGGPELAVDQPASLEISLKVVGLEAAGAVGLVQLVGERLCRCAGPRKQLVCGAPGIEQHAGSQRLDRKNLSRVSML